MLERVIDILVYFQFAANIQSSLELKTGGPATKYALEKVEDQNSGHSVLSNKSTAANTHTPSPQTNKFS